MAINKGKKTVNLKSSVADNIGIPRVHTTNYIKPVADEMNKVLDIYTETAALNHSSAFKADFNKKTADTYIDFNKTFKNNPAQMSEAAQAYNEQIINNTPPIYKEYVTAILSQKYLNSVTTATNNRTKLDNDLAVTGSTENHKLTEGDISENFQGINESQLDVGNKINQINTNSITHHMTRINENLGNDNLELVQTGLKHPKDHLTMIDAQLENLEVERLYAIMVAHDTKGQQEQGIIYLNNYAMGSDNHKLDFSILTNADGLTEDSDLIKSYKSWVKDSDNNQKVAKKAMDKFRIYKGGLTKSKDSEAKVNLDKAEESAGVMGWDNIKYGQITNAHDLVMKIDGMSAGTSKYNKAIERATTRIKVSSMVDNAWDNKEYKAEFANNKEKDLFEEAVLHRAGIFNKESLLDQNMSESRSIAFEVLKQHDIIPTELFNMLKTETSSSYNNPATIKSLKTNALIYKNLKNKDNFPYAESIDHLEYAILNDVVSMSDEDASKAMNDYANKGYEKRKLFVEKMVENIDNGFFGLSGEKYLDFMLNSELDAMDGFTMNPFGGYSNTFFLNKFITGKENVHSKHLYNKTTHWLPKKPSKLIKPQVKIEFQNMFFQEAAKLLSVNTDPDSIDLWSSKNKKLRMKAYLNTMNRLKNANYRVTQYDGTASKRGELKLSKHAVEATFGKINNLDVYNHMFMEVRKNGGAQFGGLNWKELYNRYVDGDENIRLIFEPTGSDYAGEKGFKMSMMVGDLRIDFDDNFYPRGFKNHVDENAPASYAQVKHKIVAEQFEEFKKTKLYEMLDKNDVQWAKKMAYGMLDMNQSISEFRFYPDIPGIDDAPMEVRPFKWLGFLMSSILAVPNTGMTGQLDWKMLENSYKNMGYDIRQDAAEFKTMAAIANEKLSLRDKINANTSLNNTEKLVQNLNWPGKNKHHEADASNAYKHLATTHYQNEKLPLTFRTNNWFALSSTGWDGEIPLDYTRGNRKFAVFSHPVDSARAVVRTILNNSSLTYGINDVKKVLGETPTVWDILSKIPYATNLDGYANALEKSKVFAKDTVIDLQDKNQMHKFLKFIMIHEMGGPEVFNTHFPINAQPIVDTYIMMGIEKGLAGYEGRLGTYQ